MDQLLLRVERLLETGDSDGALEATQDILALQEEHDVVAADPPGPLRHPSLPPPRASDVTRIRHESTPGQHRYRPPRAPRARCRPQNPDPRVRNTSRPAGPAGPSRITQRLRRRPP